MRNLEKRKSDKAEEVQTEADFVKEQAMQAASHQQRWMAFVQQSGLQRVFDAAAEAGKYDTGG